MKYKVRWFQDETYQVLEYGECVFQGSISDCEAYLRLREGGYL